ncbi:MAG: hypothetical protein Q8K32_06745 [Archangium sp.]|nr:hypothetical protein [Archangium sp.]
MSTLTLKQVPDSLLERLRAAAHRERRSANQQALYLLEQALELSRPSFGEALTRFRDEEGPPDGRTASAFDGVRSKERGRKVSL